MKARNAEIDLLKVIAVFAVVWLHVAGSVVAFQPDFYSDAWWSANLADAFSRWCVPVFVMVSGALLLPNKTGETPMDFYQKMTARLIPPVVFWTLVYWGVRAATDSTFTLGTAALSFIQGEPYFHLWYLYMIVGLYLATPYLRQLVSGLTAPMLRLLIIGCFTIAAMESAVGHFVAGNAPGIFLTRFLPFIGYFLAGHYLMVFGMSKSRSPARLIALAVICGLLVALGIVVVYQQAGLQACLFMYDYLNPLVIVMSLCVFVLFTQTNNFIPSPVRQLQRLAPITLGIYLVHPLWITQLSTQGISGFWVHPLLGIPVTAVLAFTLSALTATILAKLPYLNRTVR